MDTDIRILKRLISARGDFVPGSELTEALGISRPAVWQRLERMREDGIETEAVRQKGYRLLSEPFSIQPRLLAAYAALEGLEQEVIYRQNVDSTNSEAERLLATDQATPFVVIAGSQEKGRGRFGRRWHSPDAGNLYASFAFRPEMSPRQMPLITLWFGLSIAQCLNERFGFPVRIKWPNDLLLDGRKVAGMLTEARIDADMTRDLVFGLGVNIAANTNEWPEEYRSIATALFSSSDSGESAASVNRIVALVLKAVFEAYHQYITDDISEKLTSEWRRYDFLDQTEVRTEQNKRRLQGIADGIDSEGRLRLKLDDGSVQLLNSGEVTIGSGRI